MSTTFLKKTDLDQKWLVIDAKDQIVGRLATTIKKALVGKHKANHMPSMDNGDFVVVINADKVRFTGNKWEEKKYYKHTTFAGGLSVRTAKEMLVKHPEEIVRKAVWGMTNKSYLARRQMNKLKIYTGAEHPHACQNPKPLEVRADGRILA